MEDSHELVVAALVQFRPICELVTLRVTVEADSAPLQQCRLRSQTWDEVNGCRALLLGVRNSVLYWSVRILTAVVRRYYGSIIPSAFTVFSMQGFLILNCIIGGQTLASVSDRLDDTLGIVIIGIISLMVSPRGYVHYFTSCEFVLQVTFFGYRVIHWQVPRGRLVAPMT